MDQSTAQDKLVPSKPERKREKRGGDAAAAGRGGGSWVGETGITIADKGRDGNPYEEEMMMTRQHEGWEQRGGRQEEEVEGREDRGENERKKNKRLSKAIKKF